MKHLDLYKEVAKKLSYNFATGELRWIESPSNCIKIDSRAGSVDSQGYRMVRYKGKLLLEHRIIWYMIVGTFPIQIDHVDGVKDNNRLVNLREATNSQNSFNKPKQSNNTIGYKGVTFHKGTGKYQAKICVNGVRHNLGYFDNAEEASKAYIKAQGKFHGEYKRL